MNEDIKIVQLVKTSSGSPDYCLDDKGYVYKIEYNKSNLLTLVRQEINVVIPIQDWSHLGGPIFVRKPLLLGLMFINKTFIFN